MRLPVPFAIISALMLCCAGLCRPASSQTAPAKKNPGATISGKITIKGKPAPGVGVSLRSSHSGQFDPTARATTDQDGNYQITEVPSGSYQVEPVAPALVNSDVKNLRGQAVIVTEAETVEGIDFDLVRGGVITGKVTNGEGRPIIEEHVNLLPVDPGNQGGPVFSGFVNFQTDDRGIYRIFGIRPGRYQVSVGDAGSFPRGTGRARAPYAPAFYQESTDPSKPGVVKVDEGSEATGIDITVGPTVQSFKASGRIVDGETGKPVPNVSIDLSKTIIFDAHSSGSSGGYTGVHSDAQGEFSLENLAPGKYSISIAPPAESDLRADPVAFDVVDQNVTGLLIKSFIGATLSGTVVLEGTEDNRGGSGLVQAFVAAYIRNDGPTIKSVRSTTISPDGSFRVGGLQPGTASFSVDKDGKEFTVLRVERDGVVQPNGIQLQKAEQVSGIRLLIAYNNGSIRGVVKTENGTLPSSGRFLIQLMKPGRQDFLRPVDPDARGHFLIEGLGAGKYELRVIAYVPEWRERQPSAKQVVMVAAGAATDVTVTIDLSQEPEP